MALHELATNAVKHGALSVPNGRVPISWSLERTTPETLYLCWCERDGPAVSGEPTRRGLGSRVMEATVRCQLGGGLVLGWERPGLVCAINVPLRQAT